MTLKAIFFDMGGTIETFKQTRQIWLEATPGIQQRLLGAGIDLGLTNEQLCDVVSGGLRRYHDLVIKSLDEYSPQRVWCEFILAGYPFDPSPLNLIAEDLMFYVETHYYQRGMRPEVPSVLEAIKQMGLKIGLISNVNSRRQVPENLKEYGIIDYFHPIVLSSEYGRRKPDPSIFHYAARLANIPTGECAYVGDRVVRDIDGARRAGFGLAIQVRHDFEHGEDDSGATPDAVIDNMTELLDILRANLDTKQTPAKSGRVRAVIFDAGDILYFRPERGAKFTTFLKELGLKTNPDHIQKRKAIEYKAYRGEISHNEYREEVVRTYGITQPELVERGKQALIDDDDNVAFFEGVPETLAALKDSGYLLAIVTDTGNSLSTKLSWFERGGFGHVWDAITSSLELGTRKPDPKIYHAALQQLGLTPDQAVFVGHKTSELAGAREVGMRTIAFNYDKDAKADLYIEKFSDLLKVEALKT